MSNFRIFVFILIPLFFVSCSSVEENTVTAQTVNTNVRQSQSNNNSTQPEVKESQTKVPSNTFAKTFVVNSKFSDESNQTVYTENLVEFKDESDGVGIYVNSKKEAFQKSDGKYFKVRADFSETDGRQRYFVLVLSSAMGTCADAVFAVAKIDGNLKVKISKLNEPECQGELYPVKLETVDEGKEFYRRISVGKLKFNLESFDWIKDKSAKITP
jgi:hypothetical protein